MSAIETTKYIIRTSDRMQFKECRRAWDFGSKIRQNLSLAKAPIYLDFGTAIHAALQVYYDPARWLEDRHVVQAEAIIAFHFSMNEQRDAYLKHVGKDHLDGDMLEEYVRHMEMGRGMLHNYFAWAPNNDRFHPVYAEIEFEVPVPCQLEFVWQLPEGFKSIDGHLYKLAPNAVDWWPVVYQGRIDLIVEDEYGELWIWDHKTAGQMREDVIMHLEMDEQTGSYCWAIQEQLGVKIAGVLYNELYKGVPEPPKMNKVQRKGCWYSVSRSQDTSYEVYLKTVATEDKAAFEQGLYDDILRFLKAEGNKYFRRTQAHRSQTELQNLGRNICAEAIDMLGDPLIYPNHSRFRCHRCWFRSPCLALNDGSDVKWILKENYKSRTSTTNDDGTGRTDGEDARVAEGTTRL